jgi:hypothetical protein
MTNSSIDLSKNCDQLTIDCLTDLSYEAKELNITMGYTNIIQKP